MGEYRARRATMQFYAHCFSQFTYRARLLRFSEGFLVLTLFRGEIPTGHIDIKDSLESNLSFGILFSVRTLSISDVKSPRKFINHTKGTIRAMSRSVPSSATAKNEDECEQRRFDP